MTEEDETIQSALNALRFSLEALRDWPTLSKIVDDAANDEEMAIKDIEVKQQALWDSKPKNEFELTDLLESKHFSKENLRGIRAAKPIAQKNFDEANYDVDHLVEIMERLLRHGDSGVNHRAMETISHLAGLATTPVLDGNISEQRDNKVLNIYKIYDEAAEPEEEYEFNKGFEGKVSDIEEKDLKQFHTDLRSLKEPSYVREIIESHVNRNSEEIKEISGATKSDFLRKHLTSIIKGYRQGEYDSKDVVDKARAVLVRGTVDDKVNVHRIIGEVRRIANAPFISTNPAMMRDNEVRKLETLHAKLK